jgi:hypothetical protein
MNGGRDPENGSALIVAVLVTVILVLLGISFLLMAETENRIARNEERAAQALHVAEAAARTVKSWFDEPRSALAFPPPGAVDRTRRRVIDESAPHDPAAATPADGVLGSFPFYKQQVDRNGDTLDDLFDRPFRGGRLHALLGTEDGPDMLIDREGTGARAFLEQLSTRLLSGFPGESGGVRARVDRIAVFAPPYVEVDGSFRRYGIGTVLVVARIERGTDGRVLAERQVKAVLGEMPYRGAYGPLHSCGSLTFTGRPLTLRWGAVTAEGEVRLSADVDDLPLGLPRAIPAIEGSDALWDTGDPSRFDTRYKEPLEGEGRVIADPWLRVLAGGGITAPGVPGGTQPFPPTIPPAPPPECCDRSGLFQHVTVASCPEYDYGVWKGIVGSGFRGLRYFVWTGTGFRENGVGAPQSFQRLTDGGEGVFFFDTADRLPPRDDDGDGMPDNLTPPVRVRGNWSFRGFLYLNAASLRIENAVGPAVALSPPGEPYLDLDRNGRHDTGEPWINLDYGAMGGPADPVRAVADGSPRAGRGPALPGLASFRGILYTSGAFEATGSGTLYGSLIAASGVVQAVADGTAPTPALYWDPSIAAEWPPEGWALPRVTVTGWVSDP